MVNVTTAEWVIDNQDKKWTDKEKQQAKRMVRRKQQLYSTIDVSDEARSQFRDAKMIVKQKTDITR